LVEFAITGATVYDTPTGQEQFVSDVVHELPQLSVPAVVPHGAVQVVDIQHDPLMHVPEHPPHTPQTGAAWPHPQP
jgi:hypothetical protein